MANLRDVLSKYQVACGFLTLDKATYPYMVLSRDLEPRLQGFIGMPEGILFISEEVPVEYRSFMLIHEVLCTQRYAGQPGRCCKSLKEELTMVPDELRTGYLEYRRDFFRRLVEYLSSTPQPDATLLPEVRASLAHLEPLTAGGGCSSS